MGCKWRVLFFKDLKVRVNSRSECRKEGQGYRGAQHEQQDHWHGSTSSSEEHRVGTLQPFSTIITEPGKRHHLDIGEKCREQDIKGLHSPGDYVLVGGRQ